MATKPRKDRPPLDKHFFSEARLTDQWRVNQVQRYIKQTYDFEILDTAHDSLEGVMAQIYTDLFNPLLGKPALAAFRHLIRVFNSRLATTTNGIHATNKRLFYRILGHYLGHGVRPEDLTIITFNQDIQVEKSLHLMSSVARWSSIADRIFNFPGLYRFSQTTPDVTSFSGAQPDEVFPVADDRDDCISLLKLHGSLNWYSTHSSRTPTTRAMFKPNRKIRITRRRTIDPAMTLSGKQRQMYTLPVIVPPVSHKSAVLHKDMSDLWRISEERLRTADELVVFGYSCPAFDFESSNQLRRSQLGRTARPKFSLIDPEPSVSARYISLLEAKRLHYYASGHEFLQMLDGR